VSSDPGGAAGQPVRSQLDPAPTSPDHPLYVGAVLLGIPLPVADTDSALIADSNHAAGERHPVTQWKPAQAQCPGELRPAGVIKVGRRRLFRRTDVMTWIAARDAEQNGPSAA
jgi:hypothetical protein